MNIMRYWTLLPIFAGLFALGATFCYQPQTIFVHGIADTYRQAFVYHHFDMFRKPYYAFNFRDATDSIVRVNREYTVFGQHDEFALLHYAYLQVKQLQPDAPTVLYGVSRGASTVFNFVALQKAAQVNAIILESPFASFDDVVDHITNKLHLSRIPGARWCLEKLVSCIFPKYDWNGVKPIDVVHEIPKDLPILLICSQVDHLVPVSSTQKLYQALVDAGCTNVHLLKLNNARHAKFFMSPEWQLYQYAVHAFYARCGLEHDATLAKKGQWLLEQNNNSTK